MEIRTDDLDLGSRLKRIDGLLEGKIDEAIDALSGDGGDGESLHRLYSQTWFLVDFRDQVRSLHRNDLVQRALSKMK